MASDPVSEPSDPRWRATAPDDILWSTWDDDFIAYHRPSGKTHVLNAAAHSLLETVLVEARDAESTTSELLRLGFAAPGPGLKSYVSELLLRLEQIGLVRRE